MTRFPVGLSCLSLSLVAGFAVAAAYPRAEPGFASAPLSLMQTQLSSHPSPADPSIQHASGKQAATATPHATLVVDTCLDDGGGGTLRAVVGNAASGDSIDLRQLDCSAIVLQEGEIETALDDLILLGPGRDALAIEGNDAGRVFLHTGSGTLELHGVTLARGRVVDGNGGCVSSSNGSVALIDAAVSDCVAVDESAKSAYAGGGGIFAAGDITVLRSTVSDNTVSAHDAPVVGGGGLLTRFNQGGVGNIVITESLVSGNRVLSTGTGWDIAAYGGGVDSSGTVTIVRSVVSDNLLSSDSADDDDESITEGGGVHTNGLNVLDSTFSGNRVLNSGWAMDVGGGAVAARGTAVISGSTFEGNHAGMVAGGVLHRSGIPGESHLEIINSTLSGNSAGMYGGGLAALSDLVLRNSTVAFNAVDDKSPNGIGGVLIGSNDTIDAYRIESSIVSNNRQGKGAGWGRDLAVFIAADVINIVGDHNLVGESSGLNLPPDTIDGDPLLLPLADNGGATHTHALGEGSPAIDAGSNPADLESDQRGGYHVRVFGTAADIGAFEVQPTPDTIFRGTFDPAD